MALDNLISNTNLHTRERFDPDELDDLFFILRIIRPWAQFGGLTHDIGHNAFSHVFEESVHDLKYVFGIEIDGYKEPRIEGKIQKIHEDYTGVITSAMLSDGDICRALRELAIMKAEEHGTPPRKDGPSERFLDFVKKCKDDELARLVWHTVRNPRGTEIDIPKKLEDAEVRKLIENTNTIVCSLLSGPLDVDRADYILRDAYLSGINVSFDLDRYTAVLVLIKDTDSKVHVGVLEKGVSLVESFMIARFHMYREVYGHKLSMVYNGILRRIMTLLMTDNAGEYKIRIPPLNLPLIVDSPGKQQKLDEIEPIFLELTDIGILSRILEMYRAKDAISEPLRTLVKSFVERKHYVSEPVQTPDAKNEPDNKVVLGYDERRLVEGARRTHFEEYERMVDEIMCQGISYSRKDEDKEILHCVRKKQDLIYWKRMDGATLSDISNVRVYSKSGPPKKISQITGLLPLLEASRSLSILLLAAKCPAHDDFKQTEEDWIGRLVKAMEEITADAK